MKIQVDLPDLKFKVGDVVRFAGAKGYLYFQITGWRVYYEFVVTPEGAQSNVDIDALTPDYYTGKYIAPGAELGWTPMMRDVLESEGELVKEAA